MVSHSQEVINGRAGLGRGYYRIGHEAKCDMVIAPRPLTRTIVIRDQHTILLDEGVNGPAEGHVGVSFFCNRGEKQGHRIIRAILEPPAFAWLKAEEIR